MNSVNFLSSALMESFPSSRQPTLRWALTVNNMEHAIFGLLGALIGSVLGFIGSVLSTFGKSKDTSKDILTRTVTNERAQWRKDLRELSSEFVENSLRIASNDKKGSAFTLEKIRVLIRLRLNPNPEHNLDANIMKEIKNVAQQVRNKEFTYLPESLERFEHDIQSLLKKEWDKSKREAETGVLDVHDTSQYKMPSTKGRQCKER